MNVPLRDLFYVVGAVVAALGGLAWLFAYLTSRYRKAADGEKDRYIVALQERNTLLEECNERQEAQIKDMRDRLARMDGKVGMLQDMVMRQCRCAEIDPATGGCRFCTQHLFYGRVHTQEVPA
jgi:hypothetical protein